MLGDVSQYYLWQFLDISGFWPNVGPWTPYLLQKYFKKYKNHTTQTDYSYDSTDLSVFCFWNCVYQAFWKFWNAYYIFLKSLNFLIMSFWEIWIFWTLYFWHFEALKFQNFENLIFWKFETLELYILKLPLFAIWKFAT